MIRRLRTALADHAQQRAHEHDQYLADCACDLWMQTDGEVTLPEAYAVVADTTSGQYHLACAELWHALDEALRP